jgi:hypothetical protein
LSKQKKEKNNLMDPYHILGIASATFIMAAVGWMGFYPIYLDWKEDKRKARKKEKKRLKRLALAKSQT